MLQRAVFLLLGVLLAIGLLAPAVAARPAPEPYLRILPPPVTLQEPGGPMVGAVQFRRFEEIRVRYRCQPSEDDVARQRFYVEPPFAHTSPYGDTITCDGRVRNESIRVPIAVDPYGSRRQTVSLTVRFGHLMEVEDSRDLRVTIRFERWQRTVATVGPAPRGDGVTVTFAEGGSLDIEPSSSHRSRFTVDGRPATPEVFVAALSPGDRIVAYGPDIALRQR